MVLRPCDGAICAGENTWDTSECTNVTTSQCDGNPPCDGALCVGENTWDTSSCTNSCTDVCDPSCPNYDYCTCYPSECQPSCDPYGDECDPNSCSYNEPYCYFECECDDICDDLVTSPVQLLTPDGNTTAPQAKPATVVHPMCKNNEPSLPFKKPLDGAIVASLGTKTSTQEGVVQC